MTAKRAEQLANKFNKSGDEIMSKEEVLDAYVYLTVRQFCKKYQAFTEGGIRFQIFNEKTNGLAESGAIVRMGRKVLIKPEKFFAWIEAQNNEVA